MPRVDDGRRVGGGVVVPGAYEVAVRRVCEHEAAPDYRLALRWEPDAWQHYKADCEARVDVLVAERMAAAEPVTVARRVLGGRSAPIPDGAPEWLAHARWLRVWPDDRVEPGG
jgi:hypothetical protein